MMRMFSLPVIAAAALVSSPVIAQSSSASALRVGAVPVAANAFQDDAAATEDSGVSWALVGGATAAVILGVVLLVEDEDEDESTSP